MGTPIPRGKTYLRGQPVRARLAGERIAVRLTAKERILLHLLDYVRFREALEVPPAMTQEGLASAAWVELRHLSQYLRPLVQADLVRERTCHVEGIRQRRKIYDLTEKGQHAAYRLRDRVGSVRVRVRDANGERDSTLAEAAAGVPGKASLLDLVHRTLQGGTLDLERVAVAGTPVFVEMLAEAPRVQRFVGRGAEIGALTSEGPSVFVIRGVAGIGKSSVGAKVCEHFRGRRHLFWHTVRAWDTRESVLAALGDFLASMGRPGLRAAAAQGDASRGADLLREDLPGTNSLLVFDDAHEAALDVLALLRFLKDIVADPSGVRVLVLTRKALAFYDRRDVALAGTVRELELRGLTPEDITAFLGPGGEVSLEKLGQRLGGHPLFLQLLRSTANPPVHEGALRNMHRFLEEEIYAGLSEPEKRAMKTASFYRVPVPRAALSSDPSVTHDVLLALENRSLLHPIGDEYVEIHETIRSYFADVLTPGEALEYGRFAKIQLRDLASRAHASGAYRTAVDYLANAVRLTDESAEKASLLELLGDENDRVGDFPAALTAFKEAVATAEAPEVRARLHRKTAASLESRGEVSAARRELDAVRRIVGDGVTLERGWLDLIRSRVASREESPEEAREAARAALEVFETLDEKPAVARTLYELGYIEMDAHPGNLRAAELHLERGLGLARHLGDGELVAKFHMGLANLYAGRRGDVDRGLLHIAAVEDDPVALQDPQVRRALRMLQGWFQLDIRADFESAQRSFEEAADLAKRLHIGPSLAFARYGLALCGYYQGRVHEARDQLDSYGRDILAQGFPAYAFEAFLLVAECDLRLGDISGFRRVAALVAQPEFAEGLRARPVQDKILQAVSGLLRGDLKMAQSAFEAALRLGGSGDVIEEALLLHLVHFYWGIALAVLGDRKAGEDHLRESREFLTRYHLSARLSILPAAERELTATFARATSRDTAG